MRNQSSTKEPTASRMGRSPLSAGSGCRLDEGYETPLAEEFTDEKDAAVNCGKQASLWT